MLKKITQDKPLFFLWLSFFIFAIVHSICILPLGDDFIWAISTGFSDIIGPNAENGRYFTNLITYFAERIPIIRIVVMTLFMVALPAVMCKLVWNPKRKFVVSFVSIFAIMIIPKDISCETIFWLSGFTNYVIGAVFTLLYMCFCFPLFNGEYVSIKKRWAVVTALLGFLGALCVENITIFNILLVIFVIVFSFIRYKKVNVIHIVYLISTAAASVLMALSNSYSSIIVDEKDDFGLRFMELDGPDMMLKIFQEILPLFARGYYILHIIIAISVLTLYSKKIGNTKKRPKYAKLFIPIIFMYAAYSFFSSNINSIVTLTPAHRIFAIETAFTFLYIVGLIYMFYSIGNTSDFIRRTVLVVGTVIVTAPFVVVNPVNNRVFFLTCIFWCLLTVDCVVSAIEVADIKASRYVKSFGTVFVSFICLSLSCVSISNKYIDVVRINYIKEQLENNNKLISIIKLPYYGNYNDGIQIEFNTTESESNPMVGSNMYDYPKCLCEYYDIDVSFIDKQYIWIEPIGYYY